MIRPNQETSPEEPDLFATITQKELNNFDLFEAVSAGAMIRGANYRPGLSGRRYPSKITVYGAIPVANQYHKFGEEDGVGQQPVSGLVLSKKEQVPEGRMFEGLMYGEDYFDGQSDRIVVPSLTIISSMTPGEAKVIERIDRPAIHITTEVDGTQQRSVLDPTFVLDDRMELDFQQSRFAEWLGLLALRLPS